MNMKKEGTTSREAPDSHAQDNGVGTGGQTEKLIKSHSGGKSVLPKKNGGKRKGSGRKKKAETLEKLDIAAEIREHLHEVIDISVKNRETGVVKTEKRKSFRAILDTLRSKAVGQGDVAAAKEYLDRTLGRAHQSVALKHSGEVGTYTAKRPSKAALAAAQAYERSIGQ